MYITNKGRNGVQKGGSIGGIPQCSRKIGDGGANQHGSFPKRKPKLWGYLYSSFYYVINSPITKDFKHEILICF